MKPLLYATLLLGLFSCQEKKPVLVKGTKTGSSATAPAPLVRYGIEGLYTGDFIAEKYKSNGPVFDNKITICIDSLTGTTLYGHSVVAGNERPFSGAYQNAGGVFTATVQEPGNDKYDGVFRFTLDTAAKKLKGTWQPNNNALAVTERSFELLYTRFAYDASLPLPEDLPGSLVGEISGEDEKGEALTEDVLKLNASTTLLKTSDVENLYKADLEVIRNAIYARHGYSFKNTRMRAVFDRLVPWYVPVTTDVTRQLTEVENKNIELLKRYEAHATRYYDEFGR